MTRPLAAALAATLAFAAGAAAQPSERLYSTPNVPPREALDRLNLRVAWSSFVPVDGRRDGLYTVQIAPNAAKNTYEIFIQTRSGLLTALDAENGQALWATRLGAAYRGAQSVAWNSESVFVINNVELFAVDRATGRLQWKTVLSSGTTGPPAADEERLYLPLSARGLMVFELPSLRVSETAPAGGTTPSNPRGLAAQAVNVASLGASVRSVSEASAADQLGPQPRELFSYPLGSRVEQAPIVAGRRLLVPEARGTILAAFGSDQKVNARIATRGDIRVTSGYSDETAYVASGDLNLYAVNILSGLVEWRFPTGTDVLYPPAALAEDVFVTAAGAGLSRLDRTAGVELWRNDEADRFLAANGKFVYAYDRSNRLLVLDRVRGTLLSTYPATRDFVVPIPNDWTDRLYLAANNGLVVALHDKDYPRPQAMKKVPVPAAPPGSGKPGLKGADDAGAKPAPPPEKEKEKEKEGDKPAPKAEEMDKKEPEKKE